MKAQDPVIIPTLLNRHIRCNNKALTIGDGNLKTLAAQ